ncbi:MAG: hypothetical protein NVSMB29_18940 [Candidatus Dormibacteria bacterium]
MRQYRWLLVGVVALVAAAVIVVSAHPGADPQSLSTASMGTTIPAASRTPAPELTGLDGWINSPPLSLASLRGKVVLIDFWTFSCVNCVRTLPHLEADDRRYRDQGLVIIGVHSPEFDFEKKRANVADATKRLQVEYPVALDSHLNTWNAYGNQYWPAEYLIDREGRVAAVHVGEGDYDTTERNIVSLLGNGAAVAGAQPSDAPLTNSRTPEIYAGGDDAGPRGQDLADGEHRGGRGERVTYPDRGTPQQPDRIQLSGSWVDHGQWLESTTGGHVRLRFRAAEVYVVAGTASGRLTVPVRLDGRSIAPSLAGPQVGGGSLQVDRQDLFHVVTGEDPGTHTLDLEVPSGLRLYTFTFG